MSAREATLSAFRDDPLNVPLYVVGPDLTGATMAFAVKYNPDSVLSPLLGPLTIGAGITIVDTSTDADGVITTVVQVTATKTAMDAFPSAATAFLPNGADMTFYYDLQWTLSTEASAPFAPVEETKMFGAFILKGSVNA